MSTQLDSTDLKDISTTLDSLNDLWKDTVTSSVIVEWPDSINLLHAHSSTPVGAVKFDGDMEQWVFEPAARVPQPPAFG
jgi:hypothetical protein